MNDNDAMNDHIDPDRPDSAAALVEQLASIDPADAPPIAEELAGRLAAELDSTDGRSGGDPEQPS
ncbi:hypothetical protein MNBD_ACTINO01-2281 [hydrothermal vent metagenome]|uniref:Uncharacterized protein n=1 Tax=hydrothermal vent metagenome TaxID=652676 RepID=A0A3B0SN07_9ZZZZ